MSDPQAQFPIISPQQFEALTNIYVQTTLQQTELQVLTQAAANIDRCDGAHPTHMRMWLRAIDGWATEKDIEKAFLLELCKHTATGDLLDEIRRLTNPPSQLASWPDLRKELVSHFLSACEELRLQAQLEVLKQQLGETTSAYIRRFRTHASRAYSLARSASEEDRVVGAFLRGFADRHFAERLFRKGSIKTLNEAIEAAFLLEADREKMEQILHSQGHEPMEVGPLNTTVPDLGKVLASITKSIDALSTRIQKAESHNAPASPPSPKATAPTCSTQPNGRSKQKGTPPYANTSPYRPTQTASGRQAWQPQRRQPQSQSYVQNSRQHPQVYRQSSPGNQLAPPAQVYRPATSAPQSTQFQWTADGRPICAYCRIAGHKQFECRKRQATVQGTSG